MIHNLHESRRAGGVSAASPFSFARCGVLPLKPIKSSSFPPLPPGKRASQRNILLSTATFMVNSPICCLAALSSSMRGSPSRFFRALSIPSMAWFRHASKRYISTPSSRLTASNGSPLQQPKHCVYLVTRTQPLVRTQGPHCLWSHGSSSSAHRLL